MTYKPAPGMTQKQIEKELQKQATLFDVQCQNGFSISGNVKFETFAKEYFKQIETEKQLKPSTVERLHGCEERTYQAIGHLPMNKINKRHIQAFINNLSEPGINKATGAGLSTKSQQMYLSFISNVFNYAIGCDMDVVNPCGNVKVIKKDKIERNVFTVEEAQQFFDLLNTAPLKYQAFFTVALYSGFRKGEILGLKWSDIDFNNMIISVNRTSEFLKSQGGMYESTPKTKKSLRTLKLPQIAFDVLQELKTEQTKKRLLLGSQWQYTDYVFTTECGAPMGADTPRHFLEKFCDRNNLPRVCVHSFRHLNASLLIANGVDVKTVSASLGHSQVSTTLNIYAHAFQEQQAKASEVIANALPIKRHHTA